MQENLFCGLGCARTPLRELTALPYRHHIADAEGASCPITKNPTPAVGLLGLLWPFEPPLAPKIGGLAPPNMTS